MQHQAFEVNILDEFFNSIDEEGNFNALSVILAAEVSRAVGRSVS
jgi:hypothetical protein